MMGRSQPHTIWLTSPHTSTSAVSWSVHWPQPWCNPSFRTLRDQKRSNDARERCSGHRLVSKQITHVQQKKKTTTNKQQQTTKQKTNPKKTAQAQLDLRCSPRQRH